MNLIYKTKNKSYPPPEKLKQGQCRNFRYLALLITLSELSHPIKDSQDYLEPATSYNMKMTPQVS